MPATLPVFSARWFLKCNSLLLLWLMAALPVLAQPSVGFSADKTGGCSPLTVSFTNTTIGAGAGATYYWNLGNGNTSANRNASATYTEEKTYTVTLTVTENGTSSVKSMQVVVARKPVADFTVSAPSGCIPFGVTFTSTSTPGDGTLTTFVWEYGDGYAEKLSSAVASHTYMKVATPSVTLTAINNYGCAGVVHKTAVTEVLPTLTAAFTSDKTVLCTINDDVAFTNGSTGPGILKYLWEFGDGTTSAELSPKHVYAAKGEYQVKLTTSNNKGCSQTTILPTRLNVAAYSADIVVPAPICTGAYVNFASKVYPDTYNQQWTFSDGGAYGNYTYRSFATAGTQSVTLKATFDKCPVEVTRTFPVHASPVLNGYEIITDAPCGTPATVVYKDTSKWAVSWDWQFYYYGNIPNATTKTTSVTYQNDNSYSSYLTAKDANGCSATASGMITIGRPSASAGFSSSTATGGGLTNCGPFTVKFNSFMSGGTIKSYKWNIGGTISTEAEPSFTFTTPGNYGVTLTYVTDRGCTGTTYPLSATVFKRPQAAFSGQTTVCGNTSANYSSSDGAISHAWYYYNDKTTVYGGGYTDYSTVTYPDTGIYTVKLISYNGYDQGCSDTLIKTDYVKVLPPLVGTIDFTNTCEGTRGDVTFTENSRLVEKWDWDFGDGEKLSYTVATRPATVKHTYKTTGTYSVILRVTNGTCTLSTSNTVRVLLKQKTALTASTPSLCTNESLSIKLEGYENNPWAYVSTYEYYYINQLEYNDGTFFTGTATNTGNNSYYTYYFRNTYTGTLAGLAAGKTKLRTITTSVGFGCQDTSNYIPIQVNGPIPGFKVLADNVCRKQPNIFQDTSKASNSNTLVRWTWSFGDGTSEVYTKATSPVKHIYSGVSSYYVTLTVTDNQGCSASSSGMARMAGPVADFNYSPAAGTPKNTVYVYNSSYGTNTPIEYKWRFSNSKTTYTDYSPPPRTYSKAPDTDTITLIAYNTASGCADTAVKVLPVINMNTDFTMATSFLHATSCLPVFVQFTNTSYNTTGVVWDFGDGTGFEDLTNNNRYPGHIYREPGVYKVTLYGFGYYNSKDTTIDSVIIRPPAYASVTSDITESCTAKDVQLRLLTSTNAPDLTWDFGDGELATAQGKTISHSYSTAGIFQPVIIAKNGNGCPLTFSTPAPILVDSLHIGIQPQPVFICDSATVNFHPAVKNLGAEQLQRALYYHWNFGTQRARDTANTADPRFYYNLPGTYKASLRVISQAGCVEETSASITVVRTPVASITAVKEICANEGVTFKGSAVPATGVNWQWQFGNGQTANVENAGAVTYDVARSYQIRLITDNSGCADTAFHTLEVHPLPVIQPLHDTEVVMGSVVPLRATGSNDITRWSWQPIADVACPTCAITTAQPGKHTTYEVTGWTKYGCSTSQSFYVKLLCAATPIFVPNTFTPNKDGRNDLFYPRGKGVKLVKFFRVFNRAGEMIFERRNFQLNDPSQGWDGTYMGRAMGNEVLVYTSDMVCNAGETFSIKGTVMLIH